MLRKSVQTFAFAALTMGIAGAALADGGYRGSIKDAPYVAPFSWTGFYVGAHVGGAWDSASASNLCSPAGACNQAIGAGNLDSSGMIGGVHVGYNWQITPSAVIGVEGDFTWTGLGADASDVNRFATGVPVGSGGHLWSQDTNWLSSIRGRAGFTLSPTTLAYITGGFAWQRTDSSFVNAGAGGCPNCFTGGFSDTRTGYVVGGGLEMALNRNWLLRAEYLYYSLDDASAVVNHPTIVGLTNTATFSGSDIHTVRAGISYKF